MFGKHKTHQPDDVMKHQELAEQNQMENECSLSLSLSFK